MELAGVGCMVGIELGCWLLLLLLLKRTEERESGSVDDDAAADEAPLLADVVAGAVLEPRLSVGWVEERSSSSSSSEEEADTRDAEEGVEEREEVECHGQMPQTVEVGLALELALMLELELESEWASGSVLLPVDAELSEELASERTAVVCDAGSARIQGQHVRVCFPAWTDRGGGCA